MNGAAKTIATAGVLTGLLWIGCHDGDGPNPASVAPDIGGALEFGTKEVGASEPT